LIHHVVDASVAAKWIFPEAHSEAAKRLLNRKYTLNIPDFFLLEIDNILWKRTQRGEITPKEAGTCRTAFHDFPLKIHPFIHSLDLAYTVAQNAGQSLYDSLYVALAIQLDARLVTADRKLFDGLKGSPLEKHILWVEEVQAKPPSGR
jgi:predicted nucleic acid-binding protein